MLNVDVSPHLWVSGSTQVLHSPPGDPRTAQAETPSVHRRVPPAHGRLSDVLFSQGSCSKCFGDKLVCIPHNVLYVSTCMCFRA